MVLLHLTIIWIRKGRTVNVVLLHLTIVWIRKGRTVNVVLLHLTIIWIRKGRTVNVVLLHLTIVWTTSRVVAPTFPSDLSAYGQAFIMCPVNA
ncbi:hypothetical protein ACOMHN_062091 [Nucella lapillus]